MLRTFLLTLPAALLLSACAQSGRAPDYSTATPRALGAGLAAFEAPPLDAQAPQVIAPDMVEPEDELDLRQALALALLHNPELAVFSWEVRAAEARWIQAGLRPNPEIGFGLDEFAGSGARAALKAAEFALELSQVIELGGKRAARQRVAAVEKDLAAWDYEAKRLEVLTATTQAYVDALAAEKRWQLAGETSELTGRVAEVVAERVRTGKVAGVENTKAKAEWAGIQADLEKAAQQRTAARSALAAQWGATQPRFQRLAGDLERVEELPDFAELRAKLAQSPDLARWQAEMALRRANVVMARAQGVPDLTVGGGGTRFAEDDTNALSAGISLPLPLFDRNQGGKAEARVKLSQGAVQLRAVEAAVHRNLTQTWATLAAARSEALIVRDGLLPNAQKALDAASEGYRQGKWGYLDVLDAQRTLYEARARYLDALSEYHKAVAGAEGLIGESIHSSVPAPIQEG